MSLAVASSSQYRLIDVALEHFGLRGRFALVHSAEDEDVRQAAPGRLPHRGRQAGRPARRCLVWEDAPAGVLAAKAASMACIAVPEEGERDHPAFGLADLVVELAPRGRRRRRWTRWRGATPGAQRGLSDPTSEQALEPRRHLAVAGHGDQVHAVEGARVADARHESQAASTPALRSRLEPVEERRRHGEARGSRRRLRAMATLATTMTPA